MAALYAGRYSVGCDVGDIARAALAAPFASNPTSAKELLLVGLATRFTHGYAAAAPTLKTAVRMYRGEATKLEWSCLGFNVAAMDLWDDEAWFELVSAQARLARATGTLSFMAFAFSYRAGHLTLAGDLSQATGLLAELQRLDRDTGNRQRNVPYGALQLAAWRGEEAAALGFAEVLTEGAAERGEGAAATVAEYAIAVLYNGLGRYELACEAAGKAVAADEISTSSWALWELVEAAARSDARGVAAEALDRLSERTNASGTDWAQGVEARSRALLAHGPEAEGLYLQAIECLGRCRIATHLARARLSYGEWLRRENRRIDARDQLRRAFEAIRVDRRPGIRRAHAPRADRHRREGPQAHDRDTRRAHPSGGADRAARTRRPLQPRDRRTALHQRPHGRMAPPQGLRQARDQLAQRPSECPATARARNHARLAAASRT